MKNLNAYLDVSPEVAAALAENRPVVALESTIISHGMPYPQNVETALHVESIVREQGAVPATVAVINGRLRAGLTPEEIDYLGRKGREVIKVSRRDLPVVVARGLDGATTVASTMIIAALAGIEVFATGGIGGVHRGAETTMDISADLEELAMTPVMVVCAGAKSILDLGLTLEYLETKGVPVLGYGTAELPAFYTRQSGFGVDYRVDTPAELASIWNAKRGMGLAGGALVAKSAAWGLRAAPWWPTPSLRSSPWTRPPSTRPSVKRWPSVPSRASMARRPRRFCLRASRRLRATTPSTPTSSSSSITLPWARRSRRSSASCAPRVE